MVTNVSMRPIHQVCLDMEHVYLAMSYKLARKNCEVRDISAFTTDACVCHPSMTQRKKLEAAASAMTHADGSDMFRIKASSGSVVCMTEPAVTPTFDLCNDLPKWRDFTETHEHKALDEARRLVVGEGRSVCLQGFGGTGRTYAAKLIAKELMEMNKRVFCSSYTHMAAQNIAMPGADNGTLHHCVHDFPTFFGVMS